MDAMNAALGGMRNAQSALEKTADRIAGGPSQAPDSVDLSTETVDVLASRNQFQANARVFQAGDQMQKKLLDILG